MHPGYAIDRVYLSCHPVDFRKSIAGLSALVEQELGLNPFDTALFVFINRHRNRIKILYWDRNGFCLWYKRLEIDRFAWPRGEAGSTVNLSPQALQWLLEGFDIWSHGPHKTLNYQCVT